LTRRKEKNMETSVQPSVFKGFLATCAQEVQDQQKKHYKPLFDVRESIENAAERLAIQLFKTMPQKLVPYFRYLANDCDGMNYNSDFLQYWLMQLLELRLQKSQTRRIPKAFRHVINQSDSHFKKTRELCCTDLEFETVHHLAASLKALRRAWANYITIDLVFDEINRKLQVEFLFPQQ